MPLYQQVIRTFPNLKPLSVTDELFRPLASLANLFKATDPMNCTFGSDHLGIVQREARKQAPEYAKASFNAPVVLDTFLSKLPFAKNDAVLDAGSASGPVSFHVADKVEKVLALDISRHMLDEGRKTQTEKKNDNILFHHGDFHNIPVVDGKFDVVISRLALHASPEPAALIRELTRVLKPGGILAVIDFTSVSHDPETRKRMMLLYHLLDRSVVNFYTPESIERFVSGSGLEVLPEFAVTEQVASPLNELISVTKPNFRDGQIFHNAVTSNFNYPHEEEQETGFNPFGQGDAEEIIASPFHTLVVGRKPSSA